MSGSEHSTDVARIEEALLRMRRLWTHALRPHALAGEFRGRVEISHVLVVDAVRRSTPAHGEVTVRLIAEHLDIERSTASRLVDSTARAGWVTTRPSAIDGRRTVVTLTEAGVALDMRARGFRRDYLIRVLADWADADVADLARLLEPFSALIAAEPPAPEATARPGVERDRGTRQVHTTGPDDASSAGLAPR